MTQEFLICATRDYLVLQMLPVACTEWKTIGTKKTKFCNYTWRLSKEENANEQSGRALQTETRSVVCRYIQFVYTSIA